MLQGRGYSMHHRSSIIDHPPSIIHHTPVPQSSLNRETEHPEPSACLVSQVHLPPRPVCTGEVADWHQCPVGPIDDPSAIHGAGVVGTVLDHEFPSTEPVGCLEHPFAEGTGLAHQQLHRRTMVQPEG